MSTLYNRRWHIYHLFSKKIYNKFCFIFFKSFVGTTLQGLFYNNIFDFFLLFQDGGSRGLLRHENGRIVHVFDSRFNFFQ